MVEFLPDLEKNLPATCDVCIEKEKSWKENLSGIKTKISPVDRNWRTPFFFPRPSDKERILACPRGYVFGCPAKSTAPLDRRLATFMAYYVYFEKGFSFSEFLAEPPFVREAIFAIKSSSNRREAREIQKSQDDLKNQSSQNKGISGKSRNRFSFKR